jgi:hypothetical protein
MAVWGSTSPWGITSWSSGGAIAELPPTVSTTGLDAQSEALGVDIFFNGNYEMSAAGDFALVTGFAALNQGIYHRIITKPGSFVMRPGYGIGIQRWSKRRNLLADMHELEQVVEDQLSFDRRISRVNKVYVSALLDGPGVQLGFDIDTYWGSLAFKPLTFSEDGVKVA